MKKATSSRRSSSSMRRGSFRSRSSLHFDSSFEGNDKVETPITKDPVTAILLAPNKQPKPHLHVVVICTDSSVDVKSTAHLLHFQLQMSFQGVKERRVIERAAGKETPEYDFFLSPYYTLSPTPGMGGKELDLAKQFVTELERAKATGAGFLFQEDVKEEKGNEEEGIARGGGSKGGNSSSKGKGGGGGGGNHGRAVGGSFNNGTSTNTSSSTNSSRLRQQSNSPNWSAHPVEEGGLTEIVSQSDEESRRRMASATGEFEWLSLPFNSVASFNGKTQVLFIYELQEQKEVLKIMPEDPNASSNVGECRLREAFWATVKTSLLNEGPMNDVAVVWAVPDVRLLHALKEVPHGVREDTGGRNHKDMVSNGCSMTESIPFLDDDHQRHIHLRLILYANDAAFIDPTEATANNNQLDKNRSGPASRFPSGKKNAGKKGNLSGEPAASRIASNRGGKNSKGGNQKSMGAVASDVASVSINYFEPGVPVDELLFKCTSFAGFIDKQLLVQKQKTALQKVLDQGKPPLSDCHPQYSSMVPPEEAKHEPRLTASPPSENLPSPLEAQLAKLHVFSCPFSGMNPLGGVGGRHGSLTASLSKGVGFGTLLSAGADGTAGGGTIPGASHSGLIGSSPNPTAIGPLSTQFLPPEPIWSVVRVNQSVNPPIPVTSASSKNPPVASSNGGTVGTSSSASDEEWLYNCRRKAVPAIYDVASIVSLYNYWKSQKQSVELPRSFREKQLQRLASGLVRDKRDMFFPHQHVMRDLKIFFLGRSQEEWRAKNGPLLEGGLQLYERQKLLGGEFIPFVGVMALISQASSNLARLQPLRLVQFANPTELPPVLSEVAELQQGLPYTPFRRDATLQKISAMSCGDNHGTASIKGRGRVEVGQGPHSSQQHNGPSSLGEEELRDAKKSKIKGGGGGGAGARRKSSNNSKAHSVDNGANSPSSKIASREKGSGLDSSHPNAESSGEDDFSAWVIPMDYCHDPRKIIGSADDAHSLPSKNEVDAMVLECVQKGLGRFRPSKGLTSASLVSGGPAVPSQREDGSHGRSHNHPDYNRFLPTNSTSERLDKLELRCDQGGGSVLRKAEAAHQRIGIFRTYTSFVEHLNIFSYKAALRDNLYASQRFFHFFGNSASSGSFSQHANGVQWHCERANCGLSSQPLLFTDGTNSSIMNPTEVSPLPFSVDTPYPRTIEKSPMWHHGPQDFMAQITHPLVPEEEQAKLSIQRHLTAREQAHVIQSSFLIELAHSVDLLPSETSKVINEFPLVIEEVLSLSTALHRMTIFPLRFGDHIASIYSFASPEVLQSSSHLLTEATEHQEEQDPLSNNECLLESLGQKGRNKRGQQREEKAINSSKMSCAATHCSHAENVYPTRRALQYWVCGIPIPKYRRKNLVWIFPVSGNLSIDQFTAWKRWEWQLHSASGIPEEASRRSGIDRGGVVATIFEPRSSPYSGPVTFAPQNVYYADDRTASTSKEISGESEQPKEKNIKHNKLASNFLEKLVAKVLDYKCTHIAQPSSSHTHLGAVGGVGKEEKRQNSSMRLDPTGIYPSGTVGDGGSAMSNTGIIPISIGGRGSMFEMPFPHSSSFQGDLKIGGTGNPSRCGGSNIKPSFELGKDLYLAAEGHQILYPYCDAVVEVITTNYSRQCRYLASHELTATLHYNIPLPVATINSLSSGENDHPYPAFAPFSGASPSHFGGLENRMTKEDWCDAWMQALRKGSSVEETSYLTVRFDDGLTVTVANRTKPLVVPSSSNLRRRAKSRQSEVTDRFPSPVSISETETVPIVPSKPAEAPKRGAGGKRNERRRSRDKHGSARRRSSSAAIASNFSFSGDPDRPQGQDPLEVFAVARPQPPLCPPIAANGDVRLWIARGGTTGSGENGSPSLELSFFNTSTINGGPGSSVYGGSVAPSTAGGMGTGVIGSGPSGSTAGAVGSSSGYGMGGRSGSISDEHQMRKPSLTMDAASSSVTIDTRADGEDDRSSTMDGSGNSAKLCRSSDGRELRVEPLDITVASTNFVFHSREREGILWFSYFFPAHGSIGKQLSRHPETIWAVRSNIGSQSTLQPSLEFEMRRAVIESTGVVVRYFESGATQTLFPDGSISYQCREIGVHPLSTNSRPPHASCAPGGGGWAPPGSGYAAEIENMSRTQQKKQAASSFMGPDPNPLPYGMERLCETLLLSSGGVYVRSVYSPLASERSDVCSLDSTVGALDGMNDYSNDYFSRLSHSPIAPLLIQYDPTSHCHTITREDGVIIVYYYYCGAGEENRESEGKNGVSASRRTNKNKKTNGAPSPSSSLSTYPSRTSSPLSSAALPHPTLIHPIPPSHSSGPSSGFPHLPPGPRKLEAKLQQEVSWDGKLNSGDRSNAHSTSPHHNYRRISDPFPSEYGGIGISLNDIPEVYARVTLHPDGTTITTFGDHVEKLVGKHLFKKNREAGHQYPVFPTPSASPPNRKTASKGSGSKTTCDSEGGMWSTPVNMDMDASVFTDSSIAPSVSSLLHDMWMVQSTCHGKVKWCIESIRTPRIFLVSLEERLNQMTRVLKEWHCVQHGCQAPPEEIERLQVWGGSRRPYGAFYLIFGDGSVLKRHIFSRPTRGTVVPFLETILSRPTDTVLRMIHDNGMVVVERREDVQRNQENSAAAAIGEGFPVFDLALGGFRLVDYLSHVTQVQDLYSPYGVTSRITPVSWEALLQELVHETYSSHRLPKAQMAFLLARKEVEEAKHRRLRAAGLCPSLSHRMQELAEEFVISHGLLKPDVLHTLEKESLVSKGLQKVDLKKAGTESQMGVGNIVTTMIGRVPPAFFCQRANKEVIQVMNEKTMDQQVEEEGSRTNDYMHNEPMYLLRSVAVGEPGIQQLSLFRLRCQLSSSTRDKAKNLLTTNYPSSIPGLLHSAVAMETSPTQSQLLANRKLDELDFFPSIEGGSLLDSIHSRNKLSSFHNGLTSGAHYQHADGGVYDSTIADPCAFLGGFSRWHPRESQPPRHFLKPPVQKPSKNKARSQGGEIIEINCVADGEEGAQTAMKIFPLKLTHNGVRTFLHFQPVSPLVANTILHTELERDIQLSDLHKYHRVIQKTFPEVSSEATKEQKRLKKLYFAIKKSKVKS